MSLPDGIAGKALALAIVAALLLLVGASVVAPLFLLHADMRDELADLQAQQTHLSLLESQLPALRVMVRDLKRREDQAALLLPGSGDAVASAALQTRLTSFAAADAAEISSVESLPPMARDGFRRIGVHAVVTGNLTQLSGMLKSIAAARPPLFVDNLEMRHNGFSPQQGAAASPVLNVGLDVYGFRADAAQTVDAR
jgi:hypothetical protein